MVHNDMNYEGGWGLAWLSPLSSLFSLLVRPHPPTCTRTLIAKKIMLSHNIILTSAFSPSS